MITNLEQAIRHLMGSKQSITVANAFKAYIHIAGHDIEDTEKAVVTFERALDKHVVRPDNAQSDVIVKLRRQYWYNKLGGPGEGECRVCEHCGEMRLPDNKNRSSGDVVRGCELAVDGATHTRSKKRKAVKSKKKAAY